VAQVVCFGMPHAKLGEEVDNVLAAGDVPGDNIYSIYTPSIRIVSAYLIITFCCGSL
jgi:hypothetical protein